MSVNTSVNNALYLSFERQQWAALRKSVPQTLTEKDLENLRGINEAISLDEVADIYLPLTRLLNLIIASKQQRGLVLNQFLDCVPPRRPYIISIAGSVAVGKSTTARIIQALLRRCHEHPRVDLVTTDGFLYPLATLKSHNLLQRKGFPESYDIRMLIEFIAKVKAGDPLVYAPIYSHISYDRVTDTQQAIKQPDILIIEGLNVLQTRQDAHVAYQQPFVSDFVDFSIYVDAKEDLLEQWYISRFLQFRGGAFSNPDSYFHHYSTLNDKEARKIAANIWESINNPNLKLNILPTRNRAHLILRKGAKHLAEQVLLRK